MKVNPSTAPAARVLADLGMSHEEICAVLTTDDPRLVRRHFELHRERLVEEVLVRCQTLAALERELADAASRSHSDEPGPERPIFLGVDKDERDHPLCVRSE